MTISQFENSSSSHRSGIGICSGGQPSNWVGGGFDIVYAIAFDRFFIHLNSFLGANNRYYICMSMLSFYFYFELILNRRNPF